MGLTEIFPVLGASSSPGRRKKCDSSRFRFQESEKQPFPPTLEGTIFVLDPFPDRPGPQVDSQPTQSSARSAPGGPRRSALPSPAAKGPHRPGPATLRHRSMTVTQGCVTRRVHLRAWLCAEHGPTTARRREDRRATDCRSHRAIGPHPGDHRGPATETTQ